MLTAIAISLGLVLLTGVQTPPPGDVPGGSADQPDASVEKDPFGDGLGRSLLITARDGVPSIPEQGVEGTKSIETNTPNTTSRDPMAGLGQIQENDYCGWSTPTTPIPAGDPAWEGNDATAGSVRFKSCSVLFPGAPDAPGNLEGRPVELQFFPNTVAPPAPPPPNPATLAQEAIALLTIPEPAIGAGPDRTKLAVNLWTWLWIDNPGPQTVTVAAGGVSVTATATLSSVTWSLGEPVATGNGYAPGSPVTITCQGTGTPPPANYDWKAEPPCGHQFHWRSLKERTNGTGTWPITATATWDVTWASNTGVTGGTTLNATGNDAFDVAEYRIVLVGPGG